jgi:branched-chain amino acid transport system ATP-binding protein
VALLELSNLSRHFGGIKAVDRVSLEVPGGIIQAIIGPNGAGKTTLFNCITGVLPLTGGRVVFKDGDITGLKPHRIAERGILRTFQNLKLASHMTVLENVMIGRHVRTRSGFWAGMLNLPTTWREERRIREEALEKLDFLDIGGIADTAVGGLPFGKQRAVEFARALSGEPELLLLDEPASGLNIYETEELAGIILKIKERGITVLLVEHDMSLVMDISDRVGVLDFGRLVAMGTPAEVQRDERVIEIYLGGDDA